jgi:hypothetical protein
MPKAKPAPIPAPPSVKPLVVSRKVAATLLGVCLRTIDGLVSSGKLRASKLDRRLLIRVADIEKMLDATAVRT